MGVFHATEHLHLCNLPVANGTTFSGNRISGKEDNLTRHTDIFGNFLDINLTSSRNFQNKFLVEWFVFRKFNNFQVIWKRNLLPICFVNLDLLVERKSSSVFKEARKGFFVDVVFAKRLKITKKDI